VKSVIERIQNGLRNAVRENQWPVTFSMGVLTCAKIPDSVETMVTLADRLMYSVKATGKDGVKYELFDRSP
jgi:PleD family two-component response regulator